jgi:hypothetical protein
MGLDQEEVANRIKEESESAIMGNCTVSPVVSSMKSV